VDSAGVGNGVSFRSYARCNCHWTICPTIIWHVLGIQGHSSSGFYPQVFAAGPNKHEYFLRINGVAKIPTAWKNETKVEWEWTGLVAYSEGVAMEEGNKVVANDAV